MALVKKGSKKASKKSTKSTKIETKSNLLANLESLVSPEKIYVGETIKETEIKKAPTGVIGIDLLLNGGVPIGRVIELFGKEGGTKSTLSYMFSLAVKKAKESEEKVVIVDAERAFDYARAKNLGLDPDENMLVVREPSGETNLKIAIEALKNNSPCTVIDSIPALMPNEDLEKDLEEKVMATRANLLTKAMNKVVVAADENKATLIFINQLRDNMKASSPYAKQTTTTGGHAVKFLTSLRAETTVIKRMKHRDIEIGREIKLTLEKSRQSRPGSAVIKFYYDDGYCPCASILDVGVEQKVIKKKGAYLYFNEESLGQGFEKARHNLKENEDLREKIYNEIMDKVNNTNIYLEEDDNSVEVVTA